MKEKRWALIMLNRTALTVFLYASFLYFLKRIVFVKRHVWFFRIYKDEYSKYTLTALAELCGFSSRTSFFRYFKKVIGITPNEYIRSIGKTNGE